MNVRRRLVIAFVSVAILVLLLYGMVAHRTAIDVGDTEQLHLLYDIAKVEAKTHSVKPDRDTSTLTNHEFSSLIFSQSADGEIKIEKIYDSNLEQLSPTKISAMLINNKNRGIISLNGEKTLWAMAHIPSSEELLLLFYQEHHQRTSAGYESQIVARLIITAFVIIWIATWVALVISKRIVHRLDEQSSALIYQATYDELTSLPNRSSLFKALNEHIALDKTDNDFTILVLDVNRFKEVNDTIGHDNGDKLLKRLAGRFVTSLTSKTRIYRLGGDEFAILFFEQRPSAIKRLIRDIVHMLSKPFTLEGIDLPIDVSIGSASFPRDAHDASSLIKMAEVAMYQAKTQHATFLAYDEKYDPYSIKRLTLMSELRNAMKDQIVLFYQPKADLAKLKTTSVEALVRWLHPEHGLIPPDDFISMAENSGMMNELTLRIIEIAMAQSHEWHKQGLSIQIAINLSVINLLDKNLPQQVQSLLNTYQVDTKLIKFEITENSLMLNPELALSTLKALDEMNISLSIDDFGTGYSSLSYLKRLPVSELKIDRSFVKDMMNDEDDKVIVKSTIELAHNMNCSVVAEGIEDQWTYDYLIELGCDTAQGYYLSRPLPAEQLTQWLKVSRWPPA
ncbi:MAG: bifunctional diguanylate cyclase/phosphodiesterase [Candidatus Polarisedimenticolaceae bacterium]|nr:bifunctional diguanylate cyclase/phosphodiesterase [Candidatus Polarisedimenticolaceae bacterium]